MHEKTQKFSFLTLAPFVLFCGHSDIAPVQLQCSRERPVARLQVSPAKISPRSTVEEFTCDV